MVDNSRRPLAWPEAQRAFGPPPEKFIPPKHRTPPEQTESESMAREVDPAISTQSLLESDIAEVMPTLAEAAEPMPATVQAKFNATLDVATAHFVEQIGSLRTQLNEMEQMIINDCARCKSDIATHFELVKRAADQTDALSAMIKEMRATRSYLIEART